MPDPILKVDVTSQFTKVFQFGENIIYQNTHKEVVYKPELAKGFHRLGYYFQPDTSPAVGTVEMLAVENDDPQNPLLKPPVDYDQIWRSKLGLVGAGGFSITATNAIFAPIAPEGYVSMGSVPMHYDKYIYKDLPKPTENDGVMCLRFDQATKGTITKIMTIEFKSEYIASLPVTIFRVEETGVMLAATETPQDIYVPKRS